MCCKCSFSQHTLYSLKDLATELDRSKQRLEDEYASEVIVTAPTVPYKGKHLSGDCHF